jgi:hypothetical protein
VIDGVGVGTQAFPHIPTFGETEPCPPDNQFICPNCIHSVSITVPDATKNGDIISPPHVRYE